MIVCHLVGFIFLSRTARCLSLASATPTPYALASTTRATSKSNGGARKGAVSATWL